jgi:hypothetical protein
MPTDTERLDVLARNIRRLVCYEGNCRIDVKADPGIRQVRGALVGFSAEILRRIADGLLQASDPAREDDNG